jgi:hypothetical protein
MLSADTLLTRFAVYGRFYDKVIAGVPEQLRDRLEIAPHGMPIEEVASREPDLLVVMMNPGASRPVEAMWDTGAADGFAAAMPDRTQYQIMRLMVAAQAQGREWCHARILNLSDLRTPQSAQFIEKLKTYAQDDSHSLFSDAREAECMKLFACKATPVLLGWGLSAKFVPLADKVLTAVKGHPLLGLTTDGRSYRHPLPQRYDLQVAWLAQLAAQVADLP